jgi:uncharacterized protein
MISKKELQNIALKNELHLYQQEKEYALKLFLYYYYKKFEDAVFKGGTAIRFCFNLNRFSEDLDFNINIKPKKFSEQIKITLKDLNNINLNTKIIKEEFFDEAYTCEIEIQGPLFDGTKQTRNKIRIDAGKGLKTIKKANWKLIKSEYPETNQQFLVKVMDEKEILAEKIIALNTRKKGRDLYDTWFLTEIGIEIDKKLLKKKSSLKQFNNIVSKKEYEQDLKYLTRILIPYDQLKEKIDEILGKI